MVTLYLVTHLIQTSACNVVCYCDTKAEDFSPDAAACCKAWKNSWGSESIHQLLQPAQEVGGGKTKKEGKTPILSTRISLLFTCQNLSLCSSGPWKLVWNKEPWDTKQPRITGHSFQIKLKQIGLKESNASCDYSSLYSNKSWRYREQFLWGWGWSREEMLQLFLRVTAIYNTVKPQWMC